MSAIEINSDVTSELKILSAQAFKPLISEDLLVQALEETSRPPPYLSPSTDLILSKSLGEGEHAAVFQGTWKDSKKEVAVKIFKSNADCKKVRAETGIMENLSIKSPYLVRLETDYPALYDKPRYAFVMEYMPQGDLHTLLEREKISWVACYRIALAISEGLKVLHEAGILHNDVRSENVFVDDKYSAKLGDFGLATADKSRPVLDSLLIFQSLVPEATPLQSKASDISSLGNIFKELAGAVEEEIPSQFKTLIERMYQSELTKRPTIQKVIECLMGLLQAKEEKQAMQKVIPVMAAYLESGKTPFSDSGKKSIASKRKRDEIPVQTVSPKPRSFTISDSFI